MPSVTANGISIYYEELGQRGNPTLLLIMGLGQQLIAWPAALLETFAAAGFHVLFFDNRDAGLSTAFHGARTVSPVLYLLAARIGLRLPVPYTLTDMADDALGLLDALEIPAAHVLGVSMGGMIAQVLTAKAPNRVLSLTSVMSSSGARGLPGPSPEIRARLFGGVPKGITREQIVARTAETLRMIAYPDPARPADEFEKLTQRSAERSFNPVGVLRQLMAILADGSRVRRLGTIKVPTLVLHGAHDNLVPLPCGVDTAKQIPGARLEVIEPMAHDLPPSQTERVASLVIRHAQAAQGR